VLDQIGSAVIGCGKIGDTHAKTLQRLEDSYLVGVYDLDPTRAEHLARKFGVTAFVSLEDLINHPGVHMASICTPNHSHSEIIVACAQAGIHTLTEKPMATDLKGCDLAISVAKEAGTKLGIISQRRFYEPVQRVKKAIEEGKIGHPILASVTVMGWRGNEYYQMDPWRGKWSTEGGGVLLTQTTHQLDLFQWFMGSVDQLFGYWANFAHPDIEVEDTAVAVVKFKNGGLGTILVSNAQNPGLFGKIHVHGDNGASVGVQTDGGSPFIAGVTESIAPPINDIWTVPNEEILLDKWQMEDKDRCKRIDVMTYYHELQIHDFLQAIKEDRDPMVTGEEGRKQVELFSAIYRSQFLGQPINFPLDVDQGSEYFNGRLKPE
jgi:predicted dehydrogenase